jgi:two-component system, OmpR family, response regulator
MKRVLLIEDDEDLAELTAAGLSDHGFDIEWTSNGLEGLDKARTAPPDIVIVDRTLPGLDGLGIIEALRKDEVLTPVLVLSGLSKVEDRVRGLQSGGDDYLTKPFALTELVARIEALLRRTTDSRQTSLQVGALELDLIERTAKRNDREIDLLPREFRLLEYMMRRREQLLTREMLLRDVWHYNFVPDTNLLNVHMGRLRHKVDRPGETPMIYNIRGAGFVLREPAGKKPMRTLSH